MAQKIERFGSFTTPAPNKSSKAGAGADVTRSVGIKPLKSDTPSKKAPVKVPAKAPVKTPTKVPAKVPTKTPSSKPNYPGFNITGTRRA